MSFPYVHSRWYHFKFKLNFHFHKKCNFFNKLQTAKRINIFDRAQLSFIIISFVCFTINYTLVCSYICKSFCEKDLRYRSLFKLTLAYNFYWHLMSYTTCSKKVLHYFESHRWSSQHKNEIEIAWQKWLVQDSSSSVLWSRKLEKRTDSKPLGYRPPKNGPALFDTQALVPYPSFITALPLKKVVLF